jgi:hypothetical protein
MDRQSRMCLDEPWSPGAEDWAEVPMTTQLASQAAVRASKQVVSAGAPILAAKMTAPDVLDWAVPRPRITQLIAEGMRWYPLTIATGPAGAGKTMALALWAAAGPGTVAWISLDEYDNEPEVFWSYVVAALRRSGVAVPGALPAAAREADHLFLLRLAVALAAQDPSVTLVLDDLHLLTDPAVLDRLDYVLRNTGAGLRLMAAARMDPPLPLHRYRVAGQLAEIRASDLAFTVAEAGLLLARHGITLTADSLKCLTRRTEGWAAGLPWPRSRCVPIPTRTSSSGPGRLRAGLHRSGRREDWGLDPEPRYAGELVQTPRASRLLFDGKGCHEILERAALRWVRRPS